VKRAKRAALALVVSKVSKAPRVTQATVVPRDLVVVVPLVHKDPRVSRVLRAAEVKQVQEQEVRLALWVQEVNVERWESKVKRVILVHLAPKEQPVAMA